MSPMQRPLRSIVRATVVSIATAAVLTACGSGNDAAAPSAEVSAFNAADVSFAQEMIPHHLQAVTMATLAATRAEDPKVKALAAAILAGQKPEVETMESWLTTWNEPLMAGMPGMDYSEMTPEKMAATMPGGMPGMATSSDLKRLAAASGARFDHLFLTLMLTHHQGALKLAAQERADGKFPAATSLAAKIATTQTAEVAQIKKLLRS